MFWKIAAWVALNVGLLIGFYRYLRWEAVQAAKDRHPKPKNHRVL